MTHLNPVFAQSNFRIRSGDTVGLNTDSGWASGLNNSGGTPSITPGTTFRVRFEIDETNTATTPTAPSGQLECFVNADSAFDVTTSSNVVRAVASGQFSNEAATTNLLSGSGRTFDASVGSHDGLANAMASLSNEHTEVEYSIQIHTASFVAAGYDSGDTISLRVKGLDSYTNTATLTSGTVNATVTLSSPAAATGAGTLSVATIYAAPLESDATAAVGAPVVTTDEGAAASFILRNPYHSTLLRL